MMNKMIIGLIVALLSITLVVSAPLPIGKANDVDIDLTTAEKNNLTRWNITEPIIQELNCSLVFCKGEVKAVENGRNITINKLYFKTSYSYPRKKYVGFGKYADDTPRIKILTQREIEEMRIRMTEFVTKNYIAERVKGETTTPTPRYETKVGEGKVVIR